MVNHPNRSKRTTQSVWTSAYEGKFSRETWTRADGLFRVIDRSVGWREPCLRPYVVQAKDRGFSHAGHLGFGEYATAEAAMRAVDRKFPGVPA